MSLYAPDMNSERAIERMEKTAPSALVLTEFSEFELSNGLQLRVFRREITNEQVAAALAGFERHVQTGRIAMRPMTAEIYSTARDLAMRWTHRFGTRALDVLHVASALTLDADSFHTFDKRQATLAKAAGLKI